MTSLITPSTTIAELAEVLRVKGARLVCEPEDGLYFAAGVGLRRGRRYREASEMCLAAAISAALAKAGAR